VYIDLIERLGFGRETRLSSFQRAVLNILEKEGWDSRGALKVEIPAKDESLVEISNPAILDLGGEKVWIRTNWPRPEKFSADMFTTNAAVPVVTLVPEADSLVELMLHLQHELERRIIERAVKTAEFIGRDVELTFTLLARRRDSIH
jgi:hypothetical protein